MIFKQTSKIYTSEIHLFISYPSYCCSCKLVGVLILMLGSPRFTPPELGEPNQRPDTGERGSRHGHNEALSLRSPRRIGTADIRREQKAAKKGARLPEFISKTSARLSTSKGASIGYARNPQPPRIRKRHSSMGPFTGLSAASYSLKGDSKYFVAPEKLLSVTDGYSGEVDAWPAGRPSGSGARSPRYMIICVLFIYIYMYSLRVVVELVIVSRCEREL